jgi:hypothetical protein
MGLVEAIVEGSSIVREQRDIATAAGLARGQAEGVRRILRLALTDKYPGLETLPEIDQIDTVAKLESILMEQILRGSDRDSVARAIQSAAR